MKLKKENHIINWFSVFHGIEQSHKQIFSLKLMFLLFKLYLNFSYLWINFLILIMSFHKKV